LRLLHAQSPDGKARKVFGKQPLIVVSFHPLGDDEILPQTAHVIPQVRRIEVVDNGK